MNTKTAAANERLSTVVLALVLAAANVGSLLMINHYSDVLERVF